MTTLQVREWLDLARAHVAMVQELLKNESADPLSGTVTPGEIAQRIDTELRTLVEMIDDYKTALPQTLSLRRGPPTNVLGNQ